MIRMSNIMYILQPLSKEPRIVNVSTVFNNGVLLLCTQHDPLSNNPVRLV